VGEKVRAWGSTPGIGRRWHRQNLDYFLQFRYVGTACPHIHGHLFFDLITLGFVEAAWQGILLLIIEQKFSNGRDILSLQNHDIYK